VPSTHNQQYQGQQLARNRERHLRARCYPLFPTLLVSAGGVEIQSSER